MAYTIQQHVDGSFDEVVDRTIDALAEEGFGVLTDADLKATFAKKLDEEFRQYRIIGACNPTLAFEALGEELDLGALLPCNVVVYEADDGSITVSAVNPGELLSVTDNEALDPIADDVQARFERVVDAIAEH